MITWAIVGAGSAGAASRFWLDGALRRRWPTVFPWATLVINVSGSLLLGMLSGLVIDHGFSANVTLIAGTGFCGGYTTFSTASFETVRLVQRQAYGLALAHGLGSAVLTAAAGALGWVTVR